MKRYMIVIAAFAIGAVSAVGLRAFAQNSATTSTQNQTQAKVVTEVNDDKDKGADIETADDKLGSSVSDTNKETNDDGGPSDKNDTEADGETND